MKFFISRHTNFRSRHTFSLRHGSEPPSSSSSTASSRAIASTTSCGANWHPENLDAPEQSRLRDALLLNMDGIATHDEKLGWVPIPTIVPDFAELDDLDS